MREIHPRMMDFLAALESFGEFRPRYADIAKAMGGASSSLIHTLVREAFEFGLIWYYPATKRSIRLTDNGRSLVARAGVMTP